MVITVTCPSCSTSFPVDPAKIPEGGVNARCSSCGDVFRVEKPVEAEPLPTLESLEPTPELAPVPEPPPLPAPDDSAPAEPEPTASAEAAPFAPAEPSGPAASDEWVVETEEVPQVEPDPLPSFADELPSFADTETAEGSGEPVVPTSDPFSEPAPFEQEAPAAEAPVAEPTIEPEPTPEPEPAFEPEPAPEPEPSAAQAEPAVQGFTFGKRDPTDKAKRLARVLVSDMIMYNAERHQSALTSGTLVQDFEEEIEKSWKEYVEQVGDDMADGPGRQFWTDALNDILAKGKQVF